MGFYVVLMLLMLAGIEGRKGIDFFITIDYY